MIIEAELFCLAVETVDMNGERNTTNDANTTVRILLIRYYASDKTQDRLNDLMTVKIDERENSSDKLSLRRSLSIKENH